ncbi:hypothetical protein [Phytoactinopolyspora endophytica]|uniref:hypothetical protein n=1 Tax=Phytoactinopolyspora endophytica TaxID=1642495 RepID=UPI00101D15DF|nr:hypothetical protein [Phytoactinopolyspora endophytica]
MGALYPSEERRRLSRKYRWAATVMWLLVALVGMVIMGAVIGDVDGGSGPRDDLNPVVAVLSAVSLGATVIGVMVVLHRQHAFWKRAARVEVPPVLMRGTISDIAHTRVNSRVSVDVHGSSTWRFTTSDRQDTVGVPGDTVTVELYDTEGKVPGAYRNERTGRVRAITTRVPSPLAPR